MVIRMSVLIQLALVQKKKLAFWTQLAYSLILGTVRYRTQHVAERAELGPSSESSLSCGQGRAQRQIGAQICSCSDLGETVLSFCAACLVLRRADPTL